MTKVIHKYVIAKRGCLTSVNKLQMGKDAEIFSVGYQGDNICLWALVPVTTPPQMVTREILVFGTGGSCSVKANTFLITYIDGTFVWHLFDGGEVS